jgi:hypothetical protein
MHLGVPVRTVTHPSSTLQYAGVLADLRADRLIDHRLRAAPQQQRASGKVLMGVPTEVLSGALSQRSSCNRRSLLQHVLLRCCVALPVPMWAVGWASAGADVGRPARG